jgi:hypothetical protein
VANSVATDDDRNLTADPSSIVELARDAGSHRDDYVVDTSHAIFSPLDEVA